ncbi:hypothetical protein D3C87_78050 [compost metagenome]
MRASALKFTKDVLIEYLRGFLANYENYSNFCPKDYSKLAGVYDIEPNEQRKFPLVIITGSSGQVITGGLQDFVEELYDEVGDLRAYRYGGMYEFNITINIATKSTLDREQFSDLVAMALRVLIKRHIEREGIIIKDMRYGGESETTYDSDKIYIGSIQFTTWSQWYQDINLLDIGKINLEFDDRNLEI